MKLATLLHALEDHKVNNQRLLSERLDTEITHICSDSRKAHKDCIFVCVSGAQYDGHDFAMNAYEKGARIIIAQKHIDGLPYGTVLITVKDSRKALARLMGEFYSHPDRDMHIVGITGTKGKTSVALLIKHVLDTLGLSSGYIGTNGIIFADKNYGTHNTTPEAAVIYENLVKMRDMNIKYVIIEVSSQALWQDRVYGIKFDTCIFTNISADHIGGIEHPSFEHYMSCKAKLFTEYGAESIIYNADEPQFDDVFRSCKNAVLYPYSLRSDIGLYAENLTPFRSDGILGTEFDCVKSPASSGYPIGSVHVCVTTPGEFSVYNALAVLAFCDSIGVSCERASKALASARIRGRFETFRSISKPNVTFVIDYAHNQASLFSVLSTLKAYPHGRIITVFGSVGGRTYGRRAELGKVAAELSDFSILTADNPDYEPVSRITSDIKQAFIECRKEDRCTEIYDRKEAIQAAFDMAEDGDIVLLAGKGHEDYQLVAGERLSFSEYEILAELDREYSAVTTG